jgi:small redox-active disulfide protein 2
MNIPAWLLGGYFCRIWIFTILFGFIFQIFPQDKFPKQAESQMNPPVIENFYSAEAFLDSSYDVVKLLSAGKEIPVLSTGDAYKIFKEKSALFIDVRGPDEFVSGHIPSALNIPYDSVCAPKYAKTLSRIANDTRIVVYCNTHLCIVSKTGAGGNHMVVKILGTGCARCKTLEFKVRDLLKEYQLQGEVKKVSDISEMITYGIVRTPGLVINEQLKSSGVIPKDEQILQWLREGQ